MPQPPNKPQTLFKYLDIGPWVTEFLAGLSLKFTSRTAFNDPFDSRPAYTISQTPAGTAYIKQGLRRRYPHASPADLIRLRQQVLNRTRGVRMLESPETDHLLDEMGILCLSTEWDNPLLWAHYGDKHMGMCVEFFSNRDVFRLAEPVRYVETVPVIVRPDDDPMTMADKTFYMKAECWGYEKEWRIVKRKMTQEDKAKETLVVSTLSAEDRKLLLELDGHGFYKFDRSAIASITLGMNVSPDSQNLVLCAAKNFLPGVPVYRTDRPQQSYQLSRTILRP